ncbi:hypothetical protein VTK56DRAFT_4318 [Thermocarpiscus australiensis]
MTGACNMTEIIWVPSSSDDEGDVRDDNFHLAHPPAITENGLATARSAVTTDLWTRNAVAFTTDPWFQNADAVTIDPWSQNAAAVNTDSWIQNAAVTTDPWIQNAATATTWSRNVTAQPVLYSSLNVDAQYQDNVSPSEFTGFGSPSTVEVQAPGTTPNTETSDDLHIEVTYTPYTQAMLRSAHTSGGTGDITLCYDNRVSRCVLCISRHAKCEMIGTVCRRCERSRELCVRLLFSDEPIFQKWKNAEYRSYLQWGALEWMGKPFSLKVYHFANGPSLNVRCRKFDPDDDDQTTVWAKSKMGWKSERTAAIGLDQPWKPADQALGEYVGRSVQCCIEEADSNGLLKAIIRHSSQGSHLLNCALRLWAANWLLIKGWQADVGSRVKTLESPFYNTIPAPRVLQHQLDRILELYICKLELQLLQTLQTAIASPSSPRKKDAFCAALIFLNTIERDIWRLMYWTKHTEETYKWRHPEQARTLINRNVHVGKLLLYELLTRLADVREHNRTSLQVGDRRAISYDEGHEGSLDGLFTRPALDDRDPRAPADDFSFLLS